MVQTANLIYCEYISPDSYASLLNIGTIVLPFYIISMVIVAFGRTTTEQ